MKSMAEMETMAPDCRSGRI